MVYDETTTVNDIEEKKVSFTGSELDEQDGSEYSVEQDSGEKETNNYDDEDEDTENETGTESNNQYDTNEGENQYIDEQLANENAATTLGTKTTTIR